MGDPKKLKKKYSTPVHPWNLSNIEAERVIKKEYGLRNKKEIYVASSFLKKYKNIAKKLIATRTKQGEKEKAQVLAKLQQLGLLSIASELDQILGVELKDVLERRLQSIIFRKGLARTITQARQFITHRHISINGKEISMPSYLVSLKEEDAITFKSKSSLSDVEHPERAIKEVAPVEVKDEATKEMPKEEKEPVKIEKEAPAEKVEEPVKEDPKEEEKVEEAKPAEEPAKEVKAEEPVKEMPKEEVPAEKVEEPAKEEPKEVEEAKE
jgi:small subunit ribosomal protein S4